ncbi:MAG TPA: hypothetical protein PKA54_03105 [Chitinophagaceae bacterium]|nr:hypothetical protein [Chitinophagaceae bacterium]
MRKPLFLLLGIALLSFSSCKKYFTCECVTINGKSTIISSDGKLKKAEAKKWCEINEYCKLK